MNINTEFEAIVAQLPSFDLCDTCRLRPPVFKLSHTCGQYTAKSCLECWVAFTVAMEVVRAKRRRYRCKACHSMDDYTDHILIELIEETK